MIFKAVDREHFELNESGEVNIYPFNKLIKKPYANFKVLRGPAFEVYDKPVSVQFADHDLLSEHYYYKLAASLMPEEKNMIELRLDETVPQRGVDFLEKLTELYSQESVGGNTPSLSAIEFISTRLEDLKEEISDLDSMKATHQRRGVEGSTLSEKPERVKEAEDIRIRHVKSMQAIQPYAQSPLDQFTILPDHIDVGDSSLLQLISLYNKEQLDRQILLRRHEADHPLIADSNRKLATLQNSLVQTMDIKMDRLSDEIKTDKQSQGKEGVKAAHVFSAEKALTKLNKQKQAKVALYLHLLRKREEIHESVVSVKPKLTVVNKPADHISPVKAKSRSIYFLALVFGICLPMLFLSKREVSKGL